MLLAGWARRGWLALLAAAPQPVIARLDAWSREQAQRRAERRRLRALHRQARRT